LADVQKTSNQKRRQKIFSRGLYIENLAKTPLIYCVSYLIRGLGALFGS